MSTNILPALVVVSGIVAIGSLIVTVFLALFVLKSSKKHEAYILQLKEQGKYQEWLKRNKGLSIFVKISIGFGILFLLAFLVSFAKEFVTVPRILLMFSRVLIYAFYPCVFVSILVYSWLYKKALQDLRKQIDPPKASPS